MRAIAAGAALVLAVLLSGCTEAGDLRSTRTSPDATPSRTPSPMMTPASPRASVPAPPPASDDRRGRAAFASYVLEAWIYALNTNDPSPLLRVSGRGGCTGCARLVRELRTREREGWYVALDGVRVSSTVVTGSGRGGRVVMSVLIPRSRTYNVDGSLRGTNPAHRRSTFEVEMARVGKQFRLTSFSLY